MNTDYRYQLETRKLMGRAHVFVCLFFPPYILGENEQT